jgi:hypothetical protein
MTKISADQTYHGTVLDGFNPFEEALRFVEQVFYEITCNLHLTGVETITLAVLPTAHQLLSSTGRAYLWQALSVEQQTELINLRWSAGNAILAGYDLRERLPEMYISDTLSKYAD